MKKSTTAMMWLTTVAFVGMLAATAAFAEGEAAHSQIYGFVMTDVGYMGTAVNPDWFDTMRPSRLPSYKDQYGKDGQVYFSVRQSKLAVKSWVPTPMGELKTQFEFDMYGTGGDAGQTTIRPRVFYGELGNFGAGQVASAFMDLDVFPNCLDYWGPNGMLFFRNPQVRWFRGNSDKKVTIALERPGASGDAGIYADRIPAGTTVIPSFPVPDLSGNIHMAQKWGYLQLGGIVRYIKWEDLASTATSDLSGNTTGWGGTLSGNFNRGKTDVLRFQGTYGAGIENYFNDAPIDVAAKPDPGNTVTPFKGEALPIGGVSVFVDHTWNSKYSSTFGYAQNVVDNSIGQAANAFHMGQYALFNVLYTPVPDAMCGIELGWERRVNNADGFDVSNVRVQASFKYSFSIASGGGN